MVDGWQPSAVHIHHVRLNVADAERSVRWYSENLGFEEAWSWERETEDGRMINRYVADEHGTQLQLVEVTGETEFEEGTAWDHLGVYVEDTDAAFERIDAHGVDREPQDNPHSGARIAFVRDPDGHSIELFSPLDDR